MIYLGGIWLVGGNLGGIFVGVLGNLGGWNLGGIL